MSATPPRMVMPLRTLLRRLEATRRALNDASLITQAGIYFDAATLRNDEWEAKHLFDIGWRIVTPQARILIEAYLGGLTSADDHEYATLAYTHAARKIWGSIANKYQPEHGYESTIARTIQRATADVITRNHRPRTLSLDATPVDDTTESWTAHHDPNLEHVHDHDEQQAQHATQRRILKRAATRAKRLDNPLASQLLTTGLLDSIAATARHHHTTDKRITTTLAWIRQHAYALFDCSDPRFDEFEAEYQREQNQQLVIGA